MTLHQYANRCVTSIENRILISRVPLDCCRWATYSVMAFKGLERNLLLRYLCGHRAFQPLWICDLFDKWLPVASTWQSYRVHRSNVPNFFLIHYAYNVQFLADRLVMDDRSQMHLTIWLLHLSCSLFTFFNHGVFYNCILCISYNLRSSVLAFLHRM